MRIAFYAPLKAPTHPVPSGDRRVARLLMAALAAAGHDVRLACRLRTWDDAKRPGRQARLAALATRLRARLIARLERAPPDLWFTYHLYHKAPDPLGPAVSSAFGIPYVVAEASYARKQADGPWAEGLRSTAQALGRAALVLNLTRRDGEGVRPWLRPGVPAVHLPPFIDRTPFVQAAAARAEHRRRLAARLGLAETAPWLLAVGMMRGGDKQRSYQLLARALAGLGDLPWRLLVVGDGPRRIAVQGEFGAVPAERLRWLGVLDGADLAGVYAAADLFVWPAVNEAYGMALLEAQAAACPVVAGRVGGVPEVVADGVGGLLTAPGDPDALAAAVAALLADPGRRRAMGRAAAAGTAQRHDFRQASQSLDCLLRRTLEIG